MAVLMRDAVRTAGRGGEKRWIRSGKPDAKESIQKERSTP